jgi:hypothetical protein
MRSGSVPLGGLRSGELIFFTSYALGGLALPVSSVFFTLLENCGLQLHHLALHSFMLVAIFVHHCEMYVEVLLLVCLFQLFHILHSSERSAPPLGDYYFQHRSKGRAAYIAPSPLESGTAGGMIG